MIAKNIVCGIGDSYGTSSIDLMQKIVIQYRRKNMKQVAQNHGFTILLKFGTEKNLKSLQSGTMYMKNLAYYVNQEKKDSDDVIGDQYDGVMFMQNMKVDIMDPATHDVIMSLSIPKATMDFGYMQCPVFCMFRYDERNRLNETTDDGNELFGFSQEQVKYMPEFGDSVLVIKDANEFLRRVTVAMQKDKLAFAKGDVQYFEGNELKCFQDIKREPSHVAFWKRKKYAYQQEHRLLVGKQVEDHYILNIGDISDISQIMKSELMLNTVVTIGK